MPPPDSVNLWPLLTGESSAPPRQTMMLSSNTIIDTVTGYKYDYGVGRASKSFWHEQSRRRLMWSWINDDGGSSVSAAVPVALWDSTQSVPRAISLDSGLSPPRLRVRGWPSACSCCRPCP